MVVDISFTKDDSEMQACVDLLRNVPTELRGSRRITLIPPYSPAECIYMWGLVVPILFEIEHQNMLMVPSAVFQAQLVDAMWQLKAALASLRKVGDAAEWVLFDDSPPIEFRLIGPDLVEVESFLNGMTRQVAFRELREAADLAGREAADWVEEGLPELREDPNGSRWLADLRRTIESAESSAHESNAALAASPQGRWWKSLVRSRGNC